jgi:hypothetical protein
MVDLKNVRVEALVQTAFWELRMALDGYAMLLKQAHCHTQQAEGDVLYSEKASISAMTALRNAHHRPASKVHTRHCSLAKTFS